MAEVVWAGRAQQDTETMLWSINTNDPTNVDYTEPFVPIDDIIPVVVAKDPSSNYIWVLKCRIFRHLDAILTSVSDCFLLSPSTLNVMFRY